MTLAIATVKWIGSWIDAHDSDIHCARRLSGNDDDDDWGGSGDEGYDDDGDVDADADAVAIAVSGGDQGGYGSQTQASWHLESHAADDTADQQASTDKQLSWCVCGTYVCMHVFQMYACVQMYRMLVYK